MPQKLIILGLSLFLFSLLVFVSAWISFYVVTDRLVTQRFQILFITIYKNFLVHYLGIDIHYMFPLISISLPHNRQLYRLTTDRLVHTPPSTNTCTKRNNIDQYDYSVIFNARTQFHFDRCTNI